MEVELTDGGWLSASLCSQLAPYGLNISTQAGLFRSFAYNAAGSVWLGEMSSIICGKVDSYSQVANDVHLYCCSIGRYSTIGAYCDLGLANHSISALSMANAMNADSTFKIITPKMQCRPERYKENRGDYLAPITIGNDVYIEPWCMTAKGVTIGDGAIIKANTFITKDVPPYAIVAPGDRGSKIIGYRFNDEIIADLMAIKWWEYDIPAMLNQGMAVPLHNIAAFIEFMRLAPHDGFPRLPARWRYLTRKNQDYVTLYDVTPDCHVIKLSPRFLDPAYIAEAQEELLKQTQYQNLRQAFHIPNELNGSKGLVLRTQEEATIVTAAQDIAQ